MKEIEVEDWVYEGLIERCKVLGYNSLNDLIVDEILRRAVPLVYRKKVAEYIWGYLLKLEFKPESLIDEVIDEVIIGAIDRYGHLVAGIDAITGAAFELLILSMIERFTDLEYIYKGVQVGFGLKRGEIEASAIFGMPDIVFGSGGKIKGVIEAKKQANFRIDDVDRYKLKYYVKNGLRAIFVTTANEPKRSQVYQDLKNSGVEFAFVKTNGDIFQLVSSLTR